MEKIYYKEGVNIRSKEEYILKFFSKYPGSRFKTTYYFDTDFIQCRPTYRRSFDDLYWLLKSKFKSTTKGELARILLNKKNSFIGLFHCPDIHKAVIEHRKDNNDIISYINEDNNPGRRGTFMHDYIVKYGPTFEEIVNYALRSKKFTIDDIDINKII